MTDGTHVYLVVHGDFDDDGPEAWQFGIRFFLIDSGVTPDEVGTLQTYPVGAATVSRHEAQWDIVSSWKTSVGGDDFNPDDWLNDQVMPALSAQFGPGISTHSRVLGVKASPITATGVVAEGRTAIGTWTASNPTGADSGNMLPTETSVVVSWETGVIGRKGRGRIYLPPCASSALAANGRLDHTKRGALAAAIQSLIQDMALPAAGLSGIWVLPIVVNPTSLAYGQITGMNIGDVIDRQGRRRRSLVEDRAHLTLSY